ncbi:MAG TPA: hypothetical protein VF590_24955 [Isosphaeraceae bacterium]|jgi:hypothetical protein
MSVPLPELVHCPHCGAKNPAIEEACQECGRPLAVVIGPPAKVRRLGLGTLMVLIAEVAVCLAVIREMPGLGIPLLLILVPAHLRTVVAVARRKADERPMSVEDTVGAFVASMGLMVVVGVAAGIAFGTTCFAGFWAGAGLRSLWPQRPFDGLGWGIFTGVTLGGLAALFVIVVLLRRFWDRGD